MFEISEAMRVLLITRVGVDGFNDALAEADIPYRLFRVPHGYSPSASLDHHVVSHEQVRLPAQSEPHGIVDLAVGDLDADSEDINSLIHRHRDGDYVFGYDPLTGSCRRIYDPICD